MADTVTLKTFSVVHTSVFAAAPEGGNPCPVVLDADALTNGQMQAIAASLHAETIFVMKSSQPECDAQLRFFVPRHEMEMCVHGIVAAMTVLVNRGKLEPNALEIETALGPVSVDFEIGENREDLSVSVAQFPPTFSNRNPTVSEVATALQIPESSIEQSVAPIQSVSTARPKLNIPLRDYRVLDRLRPDFETLWSVCDRYETTGFYPFCLRAEQPFEVEARQFPTHAGYNEDAATGVAACALGVYLTQHAVFGAREDGWHTYRVRQGYAMGAPSLMIVESFLEKGRVSQTRVQGKATIHAEELIEINSLF